MGDALSELLIVVAGTLIAGWLARDYRNFKKAAIIKSELHEAVTYLKEGKTSDVVPIDRGKEFLKSSADSIFGSREYEIRNMYDGIEKFNNEIPGMEKWELPNKRLSLSNMLWGLNRQDRMKALPFIGSIRGYIVYKLFLIKLSIIESIKHTIIKFKFHYHRLKRR